MHTISKMLVGLSLMPASLHAVQLLAVSGSTSVVPGSWLFPGSIFLGGCALAWGMEALTRNADKNRVMIELKPNLVTVAGTSVECSYSSGDHFITSKEQLANDIRDAVTKVLFRPGQSMGLRKAAHVRVWPGSMAITDLEYGALHAVMEDEFIDPIIEVMDS